MEEGAPGSEEREEERKVAAEDVGDVVRTWYACSSNHTWAAMGFLRWTEQGEKIEYPTVQDCLSGSHENWQD